MEEKASESVLEESLSLEFNDEQPVKTVSMKAADVSQSEGI